MSFIIFSPLFCVVQCLAMIFVSDDTGDGNVQLMDIDSSAAAGKEVATTDDEVDVHEMLEEGLTGRRTLASVAIARLDIPASMMKQFRWLFKLHARAEVLPRAPRGDLFGIA